MRPILRIVIVLLSLSGLVVAAGAQQSNNEEFARRQYESGLSFLKNRQYTEALKDLQAVVDSFGATSVADNALLGIAQYQLEIARDLGAARAAAEQLLKSFAESDSAPMAHVILGRVALAKGRTSADINAALASFDRVSRLYPGSEAVPAAGYYSGETLRLARRTDEALDRFRRVSMEYPRSPWAAEASLAAGYCLVQTSRAQNAFQDFQRVRRVFPGTPAAAEALNRNSIIHRLYVRGAVRPPFAPSGRTVGSERADYKDVVGLLVDASGRILLGHKGGAAIFDAMGTLAGSAVAAEPSAFFIDEANRIVFAKDGSLLTDRAGTVALQGAAKPLEEITSVVRVSNGERLVGDGKTKTVIRVGDNGRFLGPFATGPATRLAVNDLDEVAILDKGAKSIAITDREGRPIGRLPTKGTGYEFDEPIDIAYDALSHLYVLDKGRSAVYVFGPRDRLITSVAIPEKSPGSFNKAVALAVDAAGRLLVFDERVKRIQVYQ